MVATKKINRGVDLSSKGVTTRSNTPLASRACNGISGSPAIPIPRKKAAMATAATASSWTFRLTATEPPRFAHRPTQHRLVLLHHDDDSHEAHARGRALSKRASERLQRSGRRRGNDGCARRDEAGPRRALSAGHRRAEDRNREKDPLAQSGQSPTRSSASPVPHRRSKP